MSRQYRWCVIVWSSERSSQVCWMWPKVWIGRVPSVVNLPCDFHNDLQRSHLSDSLLLVILFHQKFDGKQCIIDSVQIWSAGDVDNWCHCGIALAVAQVRDQREANQVLRHVRTWTPIKTPCSTSVVLPLGPSFHSFLPTWSVSQSHKNWNYSTSNHAWAPE